MKQALGCLPLLLALLLFPPTLSFAQEEAAPIIRSIEIKRVGPIPVSDSVVRANIRSAAGKPLSRTVLDDDVRSLYATGNFLNIRVTQEPMEGGVKVTFTIQGKAIIKDVQIKGAQKVPVARLQKKIKVKAGDVLDELKVADDEKKLEEYYQEKGYQAAKISHEIKVDEDTGRASVNYLIEEGSRVYIQRVEFVGTRAFGTHRLNRLLKTRHHWWLSWLTQTGVLKSEQFDEDLDKLKQFYRDAGYIDMDVTKVDYDYPRPGKLVIRIHVAEGVQYKVGTVQVQGNKLFPTSDLMAQLKMTGGKTFTPPGLATDLEAIHDYYGARGYIDASIRPIRSANIDTGRMDITYDIEENKKSYIEKVNITGNTKTKDKVIRRELAVAPGEVFDMVKIKRSRERLQNLGYFSKVETTPESTDVPDHKNLDVAVEEQKTGDLSFGVGFSSIDAFVGFAEIKQGNFDLFNPPGFTGGGQKMRLRAQIGTKRQDYILSFTEPWFLDQRLSLGFDAYHSEASFLSQVYTEDRTGGDIRLTRPLTEFLKGEVEWKHELVDIFNVRKPRFFPGGNLQELEQETHNAAPLEIFDERGSSQLNEVSLTLDRDTRDNVFLTTRGSRTTLTLSIADPLGDGQIKRTNLETKQVKTQNDYEFWKVDGRTSVYFPFFESKHVLLLLFATGISQQYGNSADVPFFEKFYLGGGNNLRGFRFRDVGPKVPRDPRILVSPNDANVGVGQAIGGKTYAYSTVEYTIPVISRVRFALFFDVGQVWDNTLEYNLGSLNSDAGLGLRLDLPIGPIRLDYAFPIQTDTFNNTGGQFNFNVGYQF